jgi:hypothetical protein
MPSSSGCARCCRSKNHKDGHVERRSPGAVYLVAWHNVGMSVRIRTSKDAFESGVFAASGSELPQLTLLTLTMPRSEALWGTLFVSNIFARVDVGCYVAESHTRHKTGVTVVLKC